MNSPFYQLLKVIKDLSIMKFKKKKEKNSKAKVYQYYEFCEKFPELLYLYDRVEAQKNWNNYSFKPTNLLENFSTGQRLTLIKHLKKIDRRIWFDHDKIQNILLDRWQKFNLTDAKYDELCQSLNVVYKNSPVLAVVISSPEYSVNKEFGINYEARQNELSKYTFSDTVPVPIVLTACSGMRDHYMTQDEIITKDELNEMSMIFRKEKLKKLSKL